MEPWEELEEDVAKLLRGDRTIGSGNSWQKGDVWAGRFRAECKWTEKTVMSLKVEWLETIYNRTKQKGSQLVPLLAIEWGMKHRAVLIPLSTYREFEDRQDQLSEYEITTRETPIYGYVDMPCIFFFKQIEIKEKSWVLTSWEDIRDLRKEVEEPVKKVSRFHRVAKKGYSPFRKRKI